jgi:hypothetical protein
MEPTVRHSVVKAASVVSSDGNHTVTMHELFTGWFEVANLQGAPNSTVVFYVSTSKGTLVQYGMQVRGRMCAVRIWIWIWHANHHHVLNQSHPHTCNNYLFTFTGRVHFRTERRGPIYNEVLVP